MLPLCLPAIKPTAYVNRSPRQNDSVDALSLSHPQDYSRLTQAASKQEVGSVGNQNRTQVYLTHVEFFRSAQELCLCQYPRAPTVTDIE